MTRTPGLKSVAQAAGVSLTTVSNAYNRPERLSPQLRARILAIAREQGYAGPDPAARSLRTRHADAIGVMFTVGLSYAFSDPYYVALLRGLTEVTEETGTSLLLIPIEPATDGSDRDDARWSAGAVQRAVIDGAVADGLDADHPAVQALERRGIPLVQASLSPEGPYVVVDDRAAGTAIGKHLAELGHRDVTVVVSTPRAPGQATNEVDEHVLRPYSRLRMAGIRDGLDAGARVSAVTGGSNAIEAGRAAAALILDGPGRPTAVAADSDVLALGVSETLRERGLRPGVDISVTGFDDVPAADAAGLTTIRQPIREKGQLLGRVLLDPTFTERQIVLPTELMVRGSTGPVKRPRREAASRAAEARDDSWQIGLLDLDAYLRRLRYAGGLEPDEQTLRALHREHVATIPFENLDVMLDRGISLDLARVQAKLVDQRRGGYCFEHGLLFAAVLERLGYQLDRLLVRTGDPAEHPRPRSHLVLRVRIGDEWWLADVGFGSGLLEPVPLAGTGPRQQGGWLLEVVRGGDGDWRLRERRGGEWTTLLTILEERQHLVDIEVANHNTSSHPGSPFTQRPIAMRKDETSLRSLTGRRFAVDLPDGPSYHRDLTDAEFGAELRDEFTLDLSPAEVATLVSGLPPYGAAAQTGPTG